MALPLGVHSIIVPEVSAAGGFSLEACVRRGLPASLGIFIFYTWCGVTDHPPVTRCVSWLCVYVLAVISFLLLPPQPSRAMGPSSLSPKPDSVLSVDSSPWEGGLIDGRCGGLTKSARHRLNV